MEPRGPIYGLMMVRSLLIVLGVLLLATGCSVFSSSSLTKHTTSLGGPMPEQLVRYTAPGGVRIAYPKHWHYHVPGFMTSLTDGLVDLSNQPLHNPCHTTSDGEACNWPLRRLRPGGVVVRLTEYEMGGLQPPPTAKHVQMRITQPGYCRRIGGDQTIQEMLRLSNGKRLFVDGCVRAPGVKMSIRQIEAMVNSIDDLQPKTVKLGAGQYRYELGQGLNVGDTVSCHTAAGKSAGGGVVPASGGGVGSSTGFKLEVSGDGRVTVTCPAHVGIM
jgi:hypothetical protein